LDVYRLRHLLLNLLNLSLLLQFWYFIDRRELLRLGGFDLRRRYFDRWLYLRLGLRSRRLIQLHKRVQMRIDFGISIFEEALDFWHNLLLSSLFVDYGFLFLPQPRLLRIRRQLLHAALLLGSGAGVGDVVVKNLVAVFAFDDFSLFKFTQWIAKNSRLEMEISYFPVVAGRKQDVAVETPAEVGNAHHAKIHHQSKWLCQMRLPHRNGRVLADNGNDAVALELRAWRLIQFLIDPRNIDGAAVARKACGKFPAGSVNQRRDVFPLHAPSCGGDERAI